MRKAEENVHVQNGNVAQRQVQHHSSFFENCFHGDKSIHISVVDEFSNYPVQDDIVLNNEAKFYPVSHVTFLIKFLKKLIVNNVSQSFCKQERNSYKVESNPWKETQDGPSV